jgi:hypothetical protein
LFRFLADEIAGPKLASRRALFRDVLGARPQV